MLASLLALSCGSASSSVTAPSVDKCQVTVGDAPTATFPPIGGSGSITISTTRDCTWSASAESNWVALATTSGQGDAAVAFTVAANTVPAARSSAIVIGSARVPVSQAAAPCRFDLNRTGDAIGAAGGRLSVEVSTASGCTWSASASASWIEVQSGQNGSANGTVVLGVAANAGPQRLGQVAIAGQTYTVTQDAASSPAPSPAPSPTPTPAPTPTPIPAPPPPQCSTTISPAAQTVDPDGGEVTVVVSTQAGCTWSATSNSSWITVVAGSQGGAGGTVRLIVAPNSSTTPRTGTVKISDRTFTVTQEGQPLFELSGSVSSLSGSCPNLTFNIGRTTIATDAATEYRGGSCRDLRNKKHVTVTGASQSNGTVRASRIDVLNSN